MFISWVTSIAMLLWLQGTDDPSSCHSATPPGNWQTSVLLLHFNITGEKKPLAGDFVSETEVKINSASFSQSCDVAGEREEQAALCLCLPLAIGEVEKDMATSVWKEGWVVLGLREGKQGMMLDLLFPELMGCDWGCPWLQRDWWDWNTRSVREMGWACLSTGAGCVVHEDDSLLATVLECLGNRCLFAERHQTQSVSEVEVRCGRATFASSLPWDTWKKGLVSPRSV